MRQFHLAERTALSRPRAADDFATIRARMEELRRQREPEAPQSRRASSATGSGDSETERRRRERIEGLPPPWVPTIFVKQPGT